MMIVVARKRRISRYSAPPTVPNRDQPGAWNGGIDRSADRFSAPPPSSIQTFQTLSEVLGDMFWLKADPVCLVIRKQEGSLTIFALPRGHYRNASRPPIGQKRRGLAGCYRMRLGLPCAFCFARGDLIAACAAARRAIGTR